jgi:orotidine-5'-phosphate decarboxylase
MSVREKLARAAAANRSLLCVGLDPDPARLAGREVSAFLCDIVDATRDLVCAYKPNLAFFEQLGIEGQQALRAVLSRIPGHIVTIADAKRGDVPNTAAAYARAIFDELGFDAMTVNPYGGGDSVAPFLDRADKLALVWCRSSNPGAGDLQDLPTGERGRPLYEAVAELAKAWDTRSNVGLVVGATYPEQLERVRAICPDMPVLLPGVGAQEGDLARSLDAGLDANGAGLIVAASRSVLYTSSGAADPSAARDAAEALRSAIEDHRLAARARA